MMEAAVSTDQHLLHKFQTDGGCEGDNGGVVERRDKGGQGLGQIHEGNVEAGCREPEAPRCQMKNPDKGVNKIHATVPQAPYLFGARMQKRLLKASELMRYYKMVSCHVTVSNTVYNAVIKSFTNQWAELRDQKQQMQPVVPKITGEFPITEWMDVFDDFFYRKICVRTIPFSYVTRATALASRPVPDHKDDLPHGEEFDSIEEELLA
eukprot:7762412-Ditylum_brightwellii.AAC.1